MSQFVTVPDLGSSFDLGNGTSIELNVDGTRVTVDGAGVISTALTSLGYNAGTGILTFTDEDGNPTNVDLSALTTDIFVNGASFNAATSVLTLTDNDGGTGDVTVDLSTLLGVSTNAGNVLTNGTDGKPLLTSAAVCATVLADCVVNPGTPCTDAFGNDLGYLIAP